MKTIYKYQFETLDLLTIEMPIGAEILTVQMQHNIPCMWALVDKQAVLVKRKFRIYGTGHSINIDHLKYIGTYQIEGGLLIFHLFEVL